MSNICLIIFVGLPASGKTLYAKKLIQDLISFKTIHICYDNFIEFINNDNLNVGTYKNERQKLLQLLESIINDIQNEDFNFQTSINYINQVFKTTENLIIPKANRKDNFLILLDDNNYYRSMRYEFWKLSRKYSTGYFQLYFDTPLEECIKRNEKRQFQNIPVNIVKKMYSKIESPQSISSWERNFLVINDENILNGLHNINEMIDSRLLNPEIIQILPLSLQQIEHSVLHKIDLILRKFIGEKIKIQQYNTNNDVKYYAANLNMKRKQLLEDIKKNIVEIPKNLNEIKSYININ